MHVVVLVTTSRKAEARRIAKGLLAEKLVACVNIIPGVESYFWWEGKIDSGKEFLLIVKSRKSRLVKIIRKVKSMHSYDVPEIIALPIAAGDKRYLRWIDESLGHSS